MRQKVVMITGANSGIGKALALHMAREGARVLMVCRTLAKGEAALKEIKEASGSTTISLYIADLASFDAIKELSQVIHQEISKIDVLINNAGVILPKRQITGDGIEQTLQVNFYAPYVLSELLLDLLTDGRIINVSSGAHRFGKIYYEDMNLDGGYKVFKAYGQSKLAVTMLTVWQAMTYAKKGITVNCFHPGAVGTNISVDRDSGGRGFLMKILALFFLSPEEGARTGIYLAKSQSLQEVTGHYYYKTKPHKMNKACYDPQAVTRLMRHADLVVSRHIALSHD